MRAFICLIIICLPCFLGVRTYGQTSGMAAGLNNLDRIELFYTASDRSLYHRYQLSPGGNLSNDFPVADSVIMLSLLKDADGSLVLFYLESDGELYCIRQDVSTALWEEGQLLQTGVQNMAAILDSYNRMNVFYISTDHGLFQTYESSHGVWTTGTQRAVYAGLAEAAMNEDGRLELFYTLADNTLNHIYQFAPGGDWSGGTWFAASALKVSVGQNVDGRLEVFYINGTGTLYNRWQTAPNSGWAEPYVFAGNAHDVTAVSHADGRQEIFYSSNNSYLWHRWQAEINSGFESGEQCGWSASQFAAACNTDGRLEVFYLDKDGVLFHNRQLEAGKFWAGEYPCLDEDNPLVSFGEPGEQPIYLPEEDWHVNDHTFILDAEGNWHMYGIVFPDPYSGDYSEVNYLGHAGSSVLDSYGWSTLPPPFYETLEEGDVLWAPHVIQYDGTYYMFYCGGGNTITKYEIRLRTSTDLVTWSNDEILFKDGIQARDPMVIWLEEEACWVMYYTATSNPSGGYYVVAYRTSDDLHSWSERNIAYTDYHAGTTYGNTESPFVVKRGSYYYLFIGPRPYDHPTEDMENWEHPGYVGTDIYRSNSWNLWQNKDYVGHIDVHAPEIIRDKDGDWYISHCGILQGGLYLRPMYWQDGINDLPLPSAKSGSLPVGVTIFPNPSRDHIFIDYRLDTPAFVRIEVRDMMGQLAGIPFQDFSQAGEHRLRLENFTFMRKGETGGLFLIRFITDDMNLCQTLMLLE